MLNIDELHVFLTERFPELTLYFQPPESIKLTYPCLTYASDRIVTTHANNQPYVFRNKYILTLITKNVDVFIYKRLLEIESARMERFFITDGLYHYVVVIDF